MTPVEQLRQAAQTIRDHAELATAGPWESLDNGDRIVAWRVEPVSGCDDNFEYVVDEPVSNPGNAAHIALWHPGVAAAVADWLDREAALHDVGSALASMLQEASRDPDTGQVRLAIDTTGDRASVRGSTLPQALAVARAVLGQEAHADA